MSPLDRLKRIYVALVRGARRVADASGTIAWLDRRRHRPIWLYLRSLFSIHDAADLAGLDLPWWTFGAVAHVEAELRRRGGDAVAFEFGSGASTLWLARRCRKVVSVEHDPPWAETTRQLCRADNVEIIVAPPRPVGPGSRFRSRKEGWTGLSFDDYVDQLARRDERFDLIVIDGRCRADCLRVAVAKLAPGGLIVFDNSWRRRYHAALREAPLRRRRFRGLVPGLPYPDETTVLEGP